MEWTDDAIVLSARPHGESAAVAALLTRERGRHAGLVHGGTGRKGRATLEAGAQVVARWRARLADQLGTYALEPVDNHAARLLDEPIRLAALSSACALVETTLPEREAHPALYDGMVALLNALETPFWAEIYVRWEVGLLQELGFGLDLTRCAASGATEGLAWISPRTGRAVSGAAGEEYRDRLLPLPGFLIGRAEDDPQAIEKGLALTGHFLERAVYAAHHSDLPPARRRLVELVRRERGETVAPADENG